MQGNLKDMSVADLIQHTCLDGKTAQLTIENNQQKAIVYFDAGEVIHAVLGTTEGEEVIYQILEWENGTFHLDTGKKPSRRTITKGWTGLLLEGARRLDERSANENTEKSLQTDQPIDRKEKRNMAKTRGQRLADALSELLTESSDIEGAAIVGQDGLVYAANVPMRDLDDEMVGAMSAAILGMSQRSTTQLKRGDYTRTLIQGDDGNIIVAGINDETLLVGLTPKGINLGMAFMEIRTMVETLNDIL